MEPVPVALQEEIALEGLDGITIDALWFRMSERLKLPLPFNSSFKEKLWKLVMRDNDLEYYEIEQARNTPKHLNRIDYFTNSEISYEEMENRVSETYFIYSYHPVDDPVIRGSCEEFKTRQKIDKSELEKSPLDKIVKLYGKKLVIVASQKQRNAVLIPANVGRDCDINNHIYCILERIGRARYFGEATSGSVSINSLVKDSKLLHYFRTKLIENNLVVRQVIQNKIRGKYMQAQLFHLPRFFVLIEVTHKVNTEKLFTFLSSKLNNVAPLEECRKVVGMLHQKQFRSFIKLKSNIFELNHFPGSYYEGEDDGDETKPMSKKRKQILGVRIIDPNFDVFAQYADEKEEDFDDDKGYLDLTNQRMNSCLSWQIVEKIEQSGSLGLTLLQIGKFFGLSRLNSRAVIRKIMRSRDITSYLADEGRNRVSRYVHKKFKGDKTQEIVDQVAKLLQKANESELLTTSQQDELMEENNANNSTKVSIPLNRITDTIEGVDIIDIIQQPDDEEDEEEVTERIDTTNAENPFVLNVDEPCLIEGVENVETNLKFLNSLPGVIRSVTGLAAAIEANKVSPKVLSRMNLILDHLKEKQIITITNLLAFMRQNEVDFKEVICKKSMFSICTQLAADNFLKVIEMELKSPSKTVKSIYLSEPNVTLDLKCWHSIIEEQKLVHFLRPMVEEKVEHPLKPTISNISFISKSSINDANLNVKLGLNIPKFSKYKLFHEFLFYLILDYPTEYQRIPINEAIEVWKKENQNISDLNTIASNITTCYSTDFNWKMFMPPLNQYRGYGNGWALIRDIIHRMPLILYVQFSRVTFSSLPEWQEYLEHPIKRNFLMHYLPAHMRNELFNGRKYVYLTYDLCKQLCYLGLLQMGPQRSKENDYTYVYLNRNASLWDTTTSQSDFIEIEEKEYEEHHFHFDSEKAVDAYWKKFMEFSIKTPIGKKKQSETEIIVTALQKSLTVQTAESAPIHDVGRIPGDHLGVAGVDSSFLAHIRTNWGRKGEETLRALVRRKRIGTKENSGPPKKKKKANSQVSKAKEPTPIVKKEKKKAKKKVIRYKSSSDSDLNDESAAPAEIQPKDDENLQGENLPGKKEDLVDKRALELQETMRCIWSDLEDETLVIIKAGMKFLLPNDNQLPHYISQTVVRDILHWRTEKGLTKTTAACKRRILYLVKQKSQHKEKMQMYIEELSTTHEFATKYDNFLENIKNKYKHVPRKIPLIIKIHLTELVHRMHQIFLKQYLTTSIEGESRIFVLPRDYGEVEKKFKIVLPTDTLNEFKIDEPKDSSEVLTSTISSLVHSALCCTSDKTSIQYYLYETYKKFSDEQLTKTTTQMRRLQTITHNKKTSLADNSGRVHGQARFHLSNRYAMLINNLHVPIELFDEYLESLKTLSRADGLYQIKAVNCGMIFIISELLNKEKIHMVFEKADKLIMVDPALRKKSNFEEISDNYDAALKEDQIKSMSDKKKKRNLRFASDNSIDDKFFFKDDPIEIFFKFNPFYLHLFCLLDVLEKEESISCERFKIEGDECKLKNCIIRSGENFSNEIQRIAFHSYEIVDMLLNMCGNSGGSGDENATMITQKNLVRFYDEKIDNFLFANDGSCKKDVGKVSKKIQHQITTRMFLNLIQKVATDFDQEDGAWLTDYKKISNKNTEEIYDDDEDLNSIKHSAISHQLKDIKDVSLRSSDNFVVNLSTIYLGKNGENQEDVLAEDQIDKRLFVCDERSNAFALDKIRRNHIWMPDDLVKENLLNDEMKKISNYILDQGEMGVTGSELLGQFGNKWELHSIIEQLLENKAIIRSGVNETRFIHKKFHSKWLIETFYLTEAERKEDEPPLKKLKQEEQKLQPDKPKKNLIHNPYYVCLVPWVRIGPLNRAINRRCLDKWLGSILIHISLNPGITLSDLATKFNVLNQLQIRYLCEILENIGCVKLMAFNEQKADIFSDFDYKLTEEPASYFDGFAQTYVEITTDAFAKLTVFIGKKKYKTPFV